MVASQARTQVSRTTRPTLLNSCAKAATAAEAAFRLDYPLAPSRGTRVVGLDPAAAIVVRRVAGLPWHHARFYPLARSEGIDDVEMEGVDRAVFGLAGELIGVDALVMVATTDEGANAASIIGADCTVRGIMTAGLVLVSGEPVDGALNALRPHARVLMVPADEEDLVELLKAIRA
jgi:hypothetical protein